MNQKFNKLFSDYLNDSFNAFKIPKNKKKIVSVISVEKERLVTTIHSNLGINQSVYFENKIIGYISSISSGEAYVIPFTFNENITVGDVLFVGELISIKFSPKKILGNVINPLGDNLLYEFNKEEDEIEVPVFAKSLNIKDRKPLNENLHTGINVIDACLQIGHGQRILLLGASGTGKTHLAMQILNHQPLNIITIYCFIGKKQKESYFYMKKYLLGKKNSIIVFTRSSDPIGLQVISPYVAASIAEYYRSQHKKVIVVFDDLSKHAEVYREYSLLNKAFPARDSYPGDIFYLHSSLLERALNCKAGGSITMMPIAKSDDDSISGYIPTNLISITDGQIQFSSDYKIKGYYPAINLSLSVTRIGTEVQLPLIKKVVKSAKRKISAAEEVIEDYKLIGYDNLDEITSKILFEGLLWKSAFYQLNTELPLEQFCKFYLIFHNKTSRLIKNKDIFNFYEISEILNIVAREATRNLKKERNINEFSIENAIQSAIKSI